MNTVNNKKRTKQSIPQKREKKNINERKKSLVWRRHNTLFQKRAFRLLSWILQVNVLNNVGMKRRREREGGGKERIQRVWRKERTGNQISLSTLNNWVTRGNAAAPAMTSWHSPSPPSHSSPSPALQHPPPEITATGKSYLAGDLVQQSLIKALMLTTFQIGFGHKYVKMCFILRASLWINPPHNPSAPVFPWEWHFPWVSRAAVCEQELIRRAIEHNWLQDAVFGKAYLIKNSYRPTKWERNGILPHLWTNRPDVETKKSMIETRCEPGTTDPQCFSVQHCWSVWVYVYACVRVRKTEN